MNVKETGAIMDLLTVAYPRFYNEKDAPDKTKTLKLWVTMFADDPFPLVVAAVKALICTDEKGYPPHIGAVKAKLRQLTTPDEDTEAEAWGKVLKAISRGIYNSQKEFEQFPPEIQRIVGNPNQLREWAMMDSDTVQSVVASNFQRSYRAKMQKKSEFESLPADVKQLASSVARRLTSGMGTLEAGTGENHEMR